MSTGTETGGDDGFLEEINRVELPERVTKLVNEYEALNGERDRFLWQWMYSLFPAFTLSSVAEEHRDHVLAQKMVLTMFVTVLDDLVDNRGDRATFEQARRLVENPAAVDRSRVEVSDEYFDFIEHLWTSFTDGLEDAPRGDEFEDVFEYDCRQTLNAMDYSAVVNENPRIANIGGAEHYDTHNMVMFPYADVDLMYSPEFDMADFGTVRDLLWDLQEMARIGNWLTTWEREVAEGDYSAGIVVLALQEGIVTPEELEAAENNGAEVIERIRDEDLEGTFRDRWATHYRNVRDREFNTESVDLDALVDGLETVSQYYEASQGYV